MGRRSWFAGLAMAFAAGTARAQEPQYFEPPPARSQFSLAWDFLARYDRVDHWDFYPPIDRGRFELRPEVAFEPSDRLKIGVRGVFDYGTEPYEYPANDNYRSREAAVERYYVLWQPGAFAFRGGAFGMPITATEMLWDHDIQTPGAAAAWEHPSGALTLAAAGFYGPQRNHDHSRIAVGQAIWRTGEPSMVQFEAAAAYWSFDLQDVDPVFIRENSSQVVDGRLAYASGFHVADLLFRVRFPIGSVPVLVSLDGAHNFLAQSGRKSALEATLAVGQVGTPGRWRAFYTYQYIQRDAVVAAYNSDDWWFHTWYEGHRAGIAWTILPRVYVQFTGMLQRRLDQQYWLNRYTLELVKMF